MLMMYYFIINFIVVVLLYLIFYTLSKKEKLDFANKSVFECGFTPYFNTHISISVHFYLVGLIFLFLDLELCYVVPFFMEGSTGNFKKTFLLSFFIFILLMTLIYEWKKDNVSWKF